MVTVVELKKIAKGLGMIGYSRLNKKELERAIRVESSIRPGAIVIGNIHSALRSTSGRTSRETLERLMNFPMWFLRNLSSINTVHSKRDLVKQMTERTQYIIRERDNTMRIEKKGVYETSHSRYVDEVLDGLNGRPARATENLDPSSWYQYISEYFTNGLRNRDGDLPAIIYKATVRNSSQGLLDDLEIPIIEEWWVNGVRHRYGELPAVIYSDGRQEWWVNGIKHRVNGPAIMYPDGSTEWWFEGNPSNITDPRFNVPKKNI
jgi:hypothetical protein